MENIYQKAFRNARFFLKISLGDLARKLAVNKSYISRIENGLKNPSIALMKKLEEITGLSFWALAVGDFALENQKKYTKISNFSFDMATIYDRLSESNRNYLCNRFEVEIYKFEKKIEMLKIKLMHQLKKLVRYRGVLASLEDDLQSSKTKLEYLIHTHAPEDLITYQKSYLEKIELNLATQKRKSGIRSGVEHILMQVRIEELEMSIKLREEKIMKIKGLHKKDEQVNAPIDGMIPAKEKI